MVDEKDIAVIGMSCVLPGAANLRQYWHNLANGVDAISEPPPGRWNDGRNFRLSPEHEAFLPCNRGGFLPGDLPFDPLPYGVPPNLVRHGDPDQFLMLHLMDRALRDGSVKEDSPLRRRTDVIVGRISPPTGKIRELSLKAELYDLFLELMARRAPETIEAQRAEWEDYLRSTLTPPEEDNVSTAITTLTACRAANRLNLRGAAYVVDAACASSLLAVEQAVWRLRNRQCDLAIAAGIFINLSPTFLYVFHKLGALSPSGTIRPFDRRADGLLPGEGGGAVVLKRLADALRDGDRIYALVKGVGSSSDGREVDVLAPSSAGQVAALENAFADAALDRASIGYLELHGTATVVGDEAELATIKSFFGTSSAPPTARAMGSVKSMIGHTMAAAGIASFIKTVLALSNKILPPSLHCEEPRLELLDAPFFMNVRTRPWIHNSSKGPRRAGVNAFGFGGINVHVILEEAAPSVSCPIEPGLHRPSELLVFAASSAGELDEQLHRLETFLERDETNPTLGDIAWTLARRIAIHQPYKLAFVCNELAHLRKRLPPLRQSLDTAATMPESVYFSANAGSHKGKIAGIFPGMGFPGLIGNYPDHLMDLCLHYPEVRAEFDLFEDRDRHPEDDVPTSAIFSPPDVLPAELRQQLRARLAPPKTEEYTGQPIAPRERYLAAMGVTLSNWVSWLLLRQFRIPVDMITGQSQGEMAALCAAGSADFRVLAPGFWKVLNVDLRDPSGRRLCLAWAREEMIQPLLSDHPGIAIAIHVSPECLILGGDRQELERLAERLRQQNVFVQALPYPPIHTPSLSHLRGELREVFRDEHTHFREPKMDFYSSITGEKYPQNPEAIRETLLMNVDCPLRIWQTLRRMYDDGARIFVQVGGGHMATHLQSVLPDDAESIAVALDVDTQNPLTQLNHLCGTLFQAGVPLDLAPLFAHRTLRELDLSSPQRAPTPPRGSVPLRIDWSPLANKSEIRNAKSEGKINKKTPNSKHEVLDIALPREANNLPVLGQVTYFIPERELKIERALNLDEDLFLSDHAFVRAPCKPISQCLPVLPLTMSMEFVAEAAALLAPGLGLIGFENVHALRWIGLRDRTSDVIHLECRLESVDPETGVHRIRGSIVYEGEPSLSAIVLFADSYRRDIPWELTDSAGSGAWPFAVEEVYGAHRMFHGPSFQSVMALHTLGEADAAGLLRAMPRDRLFASHPEPLLVTDPALLDGIGQFVGLFAQAHHRHILPIGVEKIEFYAPPPSPGSVVPIHMQIASCDFASRKLRSNLELLDGDGRVWARLSGWSDWFLQWHERYHAACRHPEGSVLSEEIRLPGMTEGSVGMLMPRDFLMGVDLDWCARLFLHSSEMPAFHEKTPDAQRRMLLSRAAVKDAVRVWWSRKHGGPMPHPAEFAIGHDSLGRPYLVPGDDPALPYISIAHIDAGAAAVASDVPVGIDLEEAARDTRAILENFTSAGERVLLEPLRSAHPAEAFETRLWCAKEAAGKALGAGLAGRPKDLELIEINEDDQFHIRFISTEEHLAVGTARLEPFVIAWARLADGDTRFARNASQTECGV